LGSGLGAVAALVYVSRPALSVFLAAEVLFAAAYTLHSGADEALAYDSLLAAGREGESKAVFARLESFKLAGIIAGSLAGGFIAARWGLAAPMALTAVSAALGFAVTLTLKEPPRSDTGRRPSYAAVLRNGFHYYWRHRILWVLTLDLVVTNACAWGLIWLFQPALSRAGVPVAYFGVVQALSCAGQILVLQNVPRLERWAGSKLRYLFVGSAITGLAFLALTWVRAWPLVVAGIVTGFSFGLSRLPVFSSYVNKHVSSEERATVLSIVSMMRTAAIVVVNPVVGWVAARSLNGALAGLGVALILLPALSRLEERHLVD
jgi:hypothetical protein